MPVPFMAHSSGTCPRRLKKTMNMTATESHKFVETAPNSKTREVVGVAAGIIIIIIILISQRMKLALFEIPMQVVPASPSSPPLS